jgi:monovalent cation/hydrogen antiporter
MTEILVIIVTGFVVIAAATVVGRRLGIASPLVLVALGVAASFLPFFSTLHIEPEWILEGVLPPLLYSSAVSMPTMNFRREFGAISGLSVVAAPRHPQNQNQRWAADEGEARGDAREVSFSGGRAGGFR